MLQALEHMAASEQRQLSALAIVNDEGALVGSLNILRLGELVIKMTASMVEMSVKEYLESTDQLIDSSTAPHIRLSSPMTDVFAKFDGLRCQLLFIVDESSLGIRKPIGVLTLQEALHAVLNPSVEIPPEIAQSTTSPQRAPWKSPRCVRWRIYNSYSSFVYVFNAYSIL